MREKSPALDQREKAFGSLSPIVCDAGAVVDALERDAAVGLGRDVADDVEDWEHRLLVVGLARERTIGRGERDASCESEEL